MSEEKMYRNPIGTSKLRNKLCICGSGKKTKKCHGRNYAINATELNIIKELHKEYMSQVAKELNNMKSIIEKQEGSK